MFIESEHPIVHRDAMSEAPDNLVLVYLRRIDGKIDRLTDDVQDLKHRVTSLEGQVASIRVDMAAISQRIDRIETRFDRMERTVGHHSGAGGLIWRSLVRLRPEIPCAGVDQSAALVLLAGVRNPADRPADDEQSERAVLGEPGRALRCSCLYSWVALVSFIGSMEETPAGQ